MTERLDWLRSEAPRLAAEAETAYWRLTDIEAGRGVTEDAQYARGIMVQMRAFLAQFRHEFGEVIPGSRSLAARPHDRVHPNGNSRPGPSP